MKAGLQLKIGDKWCVLGDDPSISIELTSPLWNDSGSFSYTFTVPYEDNRHIFNVSDNPESDTNLKYFRERFELYVMEVGILFGEAIVTSDMIEDDQVELELKSDGNSFSEQIDGKDLKDLELLDDNIIGYQKDVDVYEPKQLEYNFETHDTYWSVFKAYTLRGYIPVTNPSVCYPDANYCNIPIVVNMKKRDFGSKIHNLLTGEYDEGGTAITVDTQLTYTEYDDGDSVPYVLGTDRFKSSPNFFVLYILKCIFKNFEYSYNEVDDNEMYSVDDFKHMAAVNLKFDYNIKDIGGKQSIVATSANFPDVSISDFLEAFKAGFGVRYLFDESLKSVRVILLRNVFRSTDRLVMNLKNVSEVIRKQIAFNGVTVKYNGEGDDAFEYNYKTDNDLFDDYASILDKYNILKDRGAVDAYARLMIDSYTGNFYRVKVDKDSYDNGSLFEVAQFKEYSEPSDLPSTADVEEDEIEIGFNPIINVKVTENMKIDSITAKSVDEALFVDVDLKTYPSYDFNEGKEPCPDIYFPVIPPNQSYKDFRGVWPLDETSNTEDFSTLSDTDLGLTLGILRGTPSTGNLATSYEELNDNADGFGNSNWYATLKDLTFNSDVFSRNGYLYDYNGDTAGIGTSVDNLISLKLWCDKQGYTDLDCDKVDKSTLKTTSVKYTGATGPLNNRGLVPQFLSEYLYFLKNRKYIQFVAEIEPAEIVNIKWDKYYEIAGYRVLLDSVKFDVTNNGMGLVTIEAYMI